MYKKEINDRKKKSMAILSKLKNYFKRPRKLANLLMSLIIEK